MDKKGFTIIEILAVLIVLALVLAITVPSILKTINKAEKKAFINSVDYALDAAESYINDKENGFKLPDVNKGTRVLISDLIAANLLKNANEIKTGCIVVYNNNGVYNLYAFVSNGKYEVKGYQADDVNDNTTAITSLISYGGYLAGINNYYFDGGNPQLKYTPSTNFGGTNTDVLRGFELASSGFIAAGYTYSDDGDLTGLKINPDKSNPDGVIVKYDDAMNIEWKKIFGGSNDDSFYDVATLSDGYVAVGMVYSSDYDCVGLNPDSSWDTVEDALIVKYDLSGNVVWKKSYYNPAYPVTAYYEFYEVTVATDGIIAVGFSNNGSNDALVVKYDFNGNELWAKTFGGTSGEDFTGVEVVTDGIIAVGYSSSTNGDMTGTTLTGANAIMVKYNLAGTFQWKKVFGGNAGDYFESIVLDGSNLYAVGYSYSNDFDLASKHNGTTSTSDGIIVKYDLSGNIVWTRNFGGTYNDGFRVVIKGITGYAVSGYAASNDVDLTSLHYGTTSTPDAIVVNYDSAGNQTYKKNFGGTGTEYFYGLVTKGIYYYGGGTSDSNTDDFLNINKGYRDGVLVKITS